MNRRPTTYDIAQLAGVSRTTVSYVLNCKPVSIPDDTRQRVLDAADELGYRANRLAQGLAGGRTRMISMWTREVCPAYYSHTLKHLRDHLRIDQYDVQIRETQHLDATDGVGLDDGWPIDGVIAFDCPVLVDSYVDAHVQGRMPLVGMGSLCSDRTDSVSVDVFQPSLAATKHFIDSGRRRIAYAAPVNTIFTGDARYDAYRSVMDDSAMHKEIVELSPDPGVCGGSYRVDSVKAIKDYVVAHGCPEAIFCYDDERAIAILRGLRDMGIRVPDDVALIGCDGIEETEYHEPTLSTIVTPVDEMCRVAWSFLRRRIEDPTVSRQTAILEASLVVRESA